VARTAAVHGLHQPPARRRSSRHRRAPTDRTAAVRAVAAYQFAILRAYYTIVVGVAHNLHNWPFPTAR
jgi:hypothetical protein